jgi:glycine cleavage system aminomethyltransferase T/NADPH-dependent 2,4-dienoyl-CoA reductase/sulfur reductase-like enzyme
VPDSLPPSGLPPYSRETDQKYRLAAGGIVNRNDIVAFHFDGKTYRGYAGDTLASALLANGVRLVGRSFKYHRPRGIMTAGSEEPNALVELRPGARREPNTKATVAELYDGLEALSQNRFPSLKYDLLSVNSLLSPIFGAGFYYKTFMWPAKFWEKLYEPIIRRAAGLGRAAGMADPDTYEKATAFCDVLVVGAGLAGIAEALAAARAGERVILCDEDFALGGRALAEGRAAEIARQIAELRSYPEVRIFTRTTVFGVYDGGSYGAIERVADHLVKPAAHQPRQRYWKIVAKRSVLASGAIERPLLFGNNDLPGVMLSGAVRSYIGRFGVAPGAKAVLFVNNDEAAATLDSMRDAGIAVAALVDMRSEIPEATRIAAERCGARIFAGGMVRRALGGQSLQAVEITAPGGGVKIACDLLAMSGGWNPNLQLTTHLGGKPVWDARIAAFVPGDLPPGMQVVGAAAGDGAGAIEPLQQEAAGAGKAFVDFQNDVTANDVRLARQEGFSAVEHLKRYTTLGMATDQGKTANVNGLALMAALSGKTVTETGTTRFRPPYTPVAIGALAGPYRGAHFKPKRLTPTHDWAKAQGAVFIEAGMWLRAQYFPKNGEKDWLQTVAREVSAVRNHVGICDVTTLGKIDIQGPDAAKFLECVYTNSWRNLPVGRARYGLMLREDGFVMDDGTCARLAGQHFVMTTTTANAAKVMQHLEFCHQWLWPELKLSFCSVTDQWAQLAVAGPKSRHTLRIVVDPAYDISNEALPYMGVKEVTVCGGIAARLFRLSFSGELAYEIAVPARYGNALAERLMQAGERYGIIPYGTEALGVMRIEKGHPAGNELNGQTTAHDLGLGKLLSKKKDFIGRVMALRPALTDPQRPTLIGLKPVNAGDRLRAGSHLLPQGVAALAKHDQGYVTSVAYSPSAGHWIGLALLQNGPARLGEVIRVYDPVRNGDFLAEVVNPVFYDPEGARLHG